MNEFRTIYAPLKGQLIVSCQASEGDPFHSPEAMAEFAKAAIDAGAKGIRANGPDDLRAIRAAVAAPIIGIQKSVAPDGRVLITPTLEAAKALAEAGAAMIAVDCTARGQRYGALERVRRIRSELHIPVMADIATLEEAEAAAAAGADVIASTMRGYTDETADVTRFEASFIAALTARLVVPVFAEGRIHTPSEAAAALAAGAHAIIVGTAITRPVAIAKTFVRALQAESASVVAIDMGGTNTKYGIVSSNRDLSQEGTKPTPFSAGREALLEHLKHIASKALTSARAAGVRPKAIGIATAGWVNPHTGRVVYATENLPGWTGTEIAAGLHDSLGLPVFVENDANALAIGEYRFGLARGVENFLCITLGTGIGGGAYAGGQLIRGAHFFANALGHVPVVPNGELCTCSLRGCLETYTNARALLRYAEGRFSSPDDLIRAAQAKDSIARSAIAKQAFYLAHGVAAAVQLLDPELVILSGGLVQNNAFLLEELERQLSTRLTVWDCRDLRLRVSELGYHAGVLGAAAVAMNGMSA